MVSVSVMGGGSNNIGYWEYSNKLVENLNEKNGRKYKTRIFDTEVGIGGLWWISGQEIYKTEERRFVPGFFPEFLKIRKDHVGKVTFLTKDNRTDLSIEVDDRFGISQTRLNEIISELYIEKGLEKKPFFMNF